MARYFDIHPANPQRRSLTQVADIVRAGGVIAYPTDSCYALGCQLGNRDGMARIRSIRGLDDRHHLTLVCQDFAQLGQFVFVPNPVFRAIKAATPGSYTFILPATKEAPRILQHPRKKTVGVRIPRHVVSQALLAELGEPLVSSTAWTRWSTRATAAPSRPRSSTSRNPSPRSSAAGPATRPASSNPARVYEWYQGTGQGIPRARPGPADAIMDKTDRG
jgi:tRNA threonylcarbamoyl adenosine modification protein (Sua5/YciO/YrdC/YwlC family)